MKNILLLGASGSIGQQSIDIIKEHQDELCLKGVSVGKNTTYLKKLLEEFSLEFVYSLERDEDLIKEYPHIHFYYGQDGLLEIVKEKDYDLLENALVGFTGFKPTLIAIENKKNIALANKETLVAGGEIINKAIKQYGVSLLPIDSEHSAILQCLQGHNKEDINKLYITASGGAFRNKTRKELEDVTLEEALKHPTWSMGAKITIDSATMMNKGFEIMEAHYLYNIDYDNIIPIIHTKSIVHSMVEYKDGTVMAQLSSPDMRLPIRYALLYPNNREDNCVKYMDFSEAINLDFAPVDYKRYPLVKIAKDMGKLKGNFGTILIGANDEANNLFLNGKIKFTSIEKLIMETLKNAKYISNPSADDLITYNNWAKEYVRSLVNNECNY